MTVGLAAAAMFGAAAYAGSLTEDTVEVVDESELYGRWDGRLTIDQRQLCVADWPCEDRIVNPNFGG